MDNRQALIRTIDRILDDFGKVNRGPSDLRRQGYRLRVLLEELIGEPIGPSSIEK